MLADTFGSVVYNDQRTKRANSYSAKFDNKSILEDFFSDEKEEEGEEKSIVRTEGVLRP